MFFYSGVSTATSLLNILKVSVPEMGSYFITTVGASKEFYRTKFMSFELEGQVSKHLEKASAFSAGAVLMVRWNYMPWHRMLPGSFGVGNGLSYSTENLDVETTAIPKTAKLLYQIVIEFEFLFGHGSSWSAFIRDHHRSGMFGVFDGVVGGSDFLCLGIRYRL
jgi:hypothetical protein